MPNSGRTEAAFARPSLELLEPHPPRGAACLLTATFGVLAVQVATRRTGPEDKMKPEKRLFAFSILYLFAMFGALVADRWVAA